MKILLDTNVWRYLIDSEGHKSLYEVAKRSAVQIAVAPNIVIETLRLSDPVLRKKIVEVQTRNCWVHLMPDAYLECEEIKQEMLRCRPHWALSQKNVALYRKLRYDWVRASGGFWSKVRTNTSAIAKQYHLQDATTLEQAREQAREVRNSVLKKGQSIFVGKSLSEIPGSWVTVNGDRVETDFWRVYLLTVWANMLAKNSVFRQWLSCDFNVNLLLTYYAEEYLDFWEKDVRLESIPRCWIRAAMYALQSERKTTDGTPTDASIAVHLPDVDFIVSADKNFVSMANRCHEEGPSISGKGFLISGGEKGIEQLFEFIQNSGESKKEISILKNSHMGAEFPAGYF